MSKVSVLLIEDQLDISNNILDYLRLKNFDVDYASNGKQGLNLCLEHHFDVVILDIMIPGLDGLEVCSAIREQSNRHVPVIMLTARDTLTDKIAGFDVGADDYLTKPFALAELEMRCLALSKRHQLNQEKIQQVADLKLDLGRKLAYREGKLLSTNTIQFKILSVLVQTYPQVVSRSELCQRIWGDDLTESDSLRSHIYQLRNVLDKPYIHPMLKTVHGVGFVLVAEQE